MCLLVFAWRPEATETLVLAGNRDEFHERPAAPAAWWRNGTVGGRDLRAGGSWLAAHRSGRFAVVTNYREPMEEGRGPRSRGELVTGYLGGNEGPEAFAREVAKRGREYGGFNLLLGSPDTLVYVSNRGRGPELLAPGVHGLSNHLLDTPWPKLERTRARFGRVLEDGASTEALLNMLADRAPALDGELPSTGIGPEWEKLLSSPFIVSPLYGTRCSTTLKIRKDRTMEFVERRFNPAGDPAGQAAYRFPTTGDAL
jgi:uncharacterized protein with NRDE domain